MLNKKKSLLRCVYFFLTLIFSTLCLDFYIFCIPSKYMYLKDNFRKQLVRGNYLESIIVENLMGEFLQDDIPELEEYFLVNLTHVELIMAPFTSFPPRLGMVALFVCLFLFTHCK